MSALPDQLPRARSAKNSTTGSSERTLILPPILQIAGKLGIAGVLTGFAFLILGCAGFDSAMAFGPAVIALGTASAILTMIARKQAPDAWILAAGFSALLAIVGGVLELAVWMHWPILFSNGV